MACIWELERNEVDEKFGKRDGLSEFLARPRRLRAPNLLTYLLTYNSTRAPQAPDPGSVRAHRASPVDARILKYGGVVTIAKRFLSLECARFRGPLELVNALIATKVMTRRTSQGPSRRFKVRIGDSKYFQSRWGRALLLHIACQHILECRLRSPL